jgi:hypothetical protein
MEVLTVIVLGRAIERGLIALGGIAALWAGFRLFALTSQERSTATLSGHGFAFKAERIGPGVFFALFGVALLGYSAATRIEIDTKDIHAVQSAARQNPAVDSPPAASERILGIRFWGEGAKDGVPRSVAAVNTLMSIKDRYKEDAGGIKGADYVRLFRSLPHLEPFQRNYVDSQLEPGSYDRVRALEGECAKNTPRCQSYNSVAKNRQEREAVLSILGTTID